jgi:hypothetical protein
MEEFKERAEELGVQVYIPDIKTDILFARWWEYLHENNEYERLFTRRIQPLSQFMHTFQAPTLTVFAHDNEGIWMCAWFNPFSDTTSAVFMHFWGRREKRNTQEGIAVTNLVYDFATTAWPTVIGVTKHEDLLRIHRKVGYNIVGQIPQMLDNNDVWILYLTRENFEKGVLHKLGDRINGTGKERRRNASRNAANHPPILGANWSAP